MRDSDKANQEQWESLNDLARMHQDEDETSDDWDEWEETLAGIYARIEQMEEVGAALLNGIRPIRTDGEDDLSLLVSARGKGRTIGGTVLPVSASSLIRRKMLRFACWSTNHAWVITHIHYSQPSESKPNPRSQRLIDLSGYLSPRLVFFSVQCVRCGQSGREEMVQATTIPAEVEQMQIEQE